jgi:chromosome segregation ATPase
MSRVNLESAKNNIERILTSLNEIQQLLSSKTQEINSRVREFNDSLTSYFRQAEEKDQQINQEEEKKANNSSTLDQDNQKLQELTHNKDVLQSEITSKQRDIEQLSALILEREKIFTELSVQVDSLTERISDLKRKDEELEVLTQATLDEVKEELRRKEIQHAELSTEYNKMISRTKALKYLVKQDIVNFPEIQVIRSLTVPGVDNEENLKKTSGVSDEIIRNILTDLDRRGIIAFDIHTGKFQVLTELDI